MPDDITKGRQPWEAGAYGLSGATVDAQAVSVALLRLSVRTLEYVGFEETNARMECDREMREQAKAGIRLLGLDPKAEYDKHMQNIKKHRKATASCWAPPRKPRR